MKEIVCENVKAAGPYSAATEENGFVFVSGQIALCVDGTPIKNAGEAAAKAFDNIEAILASAGLTLKNVVKTTVYLTDLKSFSEVNAEYEKRFSVPYPARVCVGVCSLPKGSVIEIECTAARF